MPETERLEIIGQLTPSSLDEAEHLRGDSKSSEVLAPARDCGWKKGSRHSGKHIRRNQPGHVRGSTFSSLKGAKRSG